MCVCVCVSSVSVCVHVFYSCRKFFCPFFFLRFLNLIFTLLYLLPLGCVRWGFASSDHDINYDVKCKLKDHNFSAQCISRSLLSKGLLKTWVIFGHHITLQGISFFKDMIFNTWPMSVPLATSPWLYNIRSRFSSSSISFLVLLLKFSFLFFVITICCHSLFEPVFSLRYVY